ncbi:complexin-2 [Centroberyx affinis]|uniref:complexin-2 n=1 Tax=Centroberyx affinis TaxID=166261 RepID=UPI003A5BC58A
MANQAGSQALPSPAPERQINTQIKFSLCWTIHNSYTLRWSCIYYRSDRGATKDMGKMLGGEEEKDPDAAKKEEERQEALRQQEEERKAKHARMEAEREKVRQTIRDKYGLKKKEEKEAEEKAAMEQACEGSLTRPKKAIPTGCGDDDEDDEESILDTVLKFLPGPLQDMFKK